MVLGVPHSYDLTFDTISNSLHLKQIWSTSYIIFLNISNLGQVFVGVRLN